MSKDYDVSVTTHAYERAKERLSWSRKVCKKEAIRAYQYGVRHPEDTEKIYEALLTHLGVKDKTSDRVVIKDEIIFIFSNRLLVTLYKIPNELKRMYYNLKDN